MQYCKVSMYAYDVWSEYRTTSIGSHTHVVYMGDISTLYGRLNNLLYER